jgi:UDP-N-acetylglucosamine transferase subunit ALG13
MTELTERKKALVFVTVGTDHHPFDRLIRWIDGWLAAGGGERARCLVQTGRSERPRLAEATDYLAYDEMKGAVDEAAAVITHGGPGSISLSMSLGKRPIVVPRQRSLGEHVDDHQVAFARRMAAEGTIELAETEEVFRAALERSLQSTAEATPSEAPKPVEAVRRFEELVGKLMEDGRAGAKQPSPAARTVEGLGHRSVCVLYVGGAGRSGSTLLDLMLGQVPGCFAVGELKYIWKRGVRDNELCGCGQPFHSCSFWSAVGERAFGGWHHVDVEEVLELERSVDSHRFIPLMWRPGLRPRYGSRFERYAALVARLYEGIADVSGAEVIVDSTKRPSTAFLLASVPGVDLRLAQLVRDSRGVAFSWSKRVKRPEVTEHVDFMPRYDSLRAGARWMANNSLLHGLAMLGVPGIRIRYESLIAAPRREVARVLSHVGLAVEPEALSFLDGSELEAKTNHVVAGNPVRLERKSLELSLDDAWRTQMDRRQRFLVLLLTWPLLLRYGYLGGTSGTHTSGDPMAHDVAGRRGLDD